MKIKENYALEFKYANYRADRFSTDTQKFWVTFVADFKHKLK